MVATRNHPKDFDPPQLDSKASPTPSAASPTKRSTRASSATVTAAISTPTSTRSPPTTTLTTPSPSTNAWTHTPSTLTLLWLAISLPLVIWDTGYVLLRPHSMPGGSLHSPIWTPYKLYGSIDFVYGFPSYEAGNGWTSAQGLVNAFETAAYLVYLYLVWAYGAQDPGTKGRGAPEKGVGRLAESRTLTGRVAAIAVMIGYSTALVTFAKTVLYWLIEFYSGFDSIGHNDWTTLVFLWIIPNGAWIVFPAYMCYVFGSEVVEGLETAVSGTKGGAAGRKKRN